MTEMNWLRQLRFVALLPFLNGEKTQPLADIMERRLAAFALEE